MCAIYDVNAASLGLLALIAPIAIWHIAYASIGLHKGAPSLEIHPDRLVVRTAYGGERVLTRDGLVSFTLVPEGYETDARVVAHGERSSFREPSWSLLRFDTVLPGELALKPEELEPILTAWLQGRSGPA
jgi:hypothetical protein